MRAIAAFAILFFPVAALALDESKAVAEKNRIRAEEVAVPSGRLIGKTYFGLHLHRADTTTPWPQVEFGYMRLWDSNTAWINLQTYPVTWDFDRLDKLVALAEANGVEVALTLGSTPRWASARPSEKCGYGTGCAAEPAQISDWENYVRTVAERYRGRICYYEIWNEPDFNASSNVGGFFTGTADKMVELASTAYRIIKQIDPGAKVLSPAAVADTARIEPFLKVGGGKTFDILAVHFYALPPENIVGYVAQFKSLLAKYGLQGKPIWNTESGFLISDKESAPESLNLDLSKGVFGNKLDQETAAAFVARHLILGAALGLERSALYAWDNKEMGFTDMRTHEPNRVGIAYGTVASWLIGSRLLGCVRKNASLWQCEITRGGRRAWIVWSTVRDAVFDANSLSVAIRVKESLDARIESVRSGDIIHLGLAPILLKSDSGPW